MALRTIRQPRIFMKSLLLLQMLENLSFSQILSDLLEYNDRTRKELLHYLWDNGFDIGQTSIDRYFNGSRFPRGKRGKEFIILFAQYLDLNCEEKKQLILAWNLRKSRYLAP